MLIIPEKRQMGYYTFEECVGKITLNHNTPSSITRYFMRCAPHTLIIKKKL